MSSVSKLAVVKTDVRSAIYKYLEITIPFHKLIHSEMKAVATILYMYYLSEEKDEIDRWAEVFTYDNRVKIREKLGDMSVASFNNILSNLRRKGVIKNNRVNPVYNPSIKKDTKSFEVTIKFKFDE